MSDVQHLIELLKSDNPNKRYDACEELRVAPSLPPEALDAFRQVINDANPDVADAAQRALALHVPQAKTDVVAEKDEATTNKGVNIRGLDIVIGFFGWAILSNVWFFICVWYAGSYTLILYNGLLLIAGVYLVRIKKAGIVIGSIITIFISNILLISLGVPLSLNLLLLPFPIGMFALGQ